MNYKLHHADCLDIMRAMPDASVNLIATDPPYFKVKGEAWDRQWKDADKFLAWLGTIADEWRRILAPNGSLYCFAWAALSSEVKALIKQRFHVLNEITWVKSAGWQKRACKEELRKYFTQTEKVIFAEQRGAELADEYSYASACEKLRVEVMAPLSTYMAHALKSSRLIRSDVDKAWQLKRGTKGCMSPHWFGKASQWALPTETNYEWLRQLLGLQYLTREYESLRVEYESLRVEYESLRRPFNVSADVPYTDVWTFPTVSRRPGKHPCEKPYAMAEHIVRASARPGDHVFDPFMGSGVFGKAALDYGCMFTGVDKTEKYFKQASENLA